MHPFTTYGEWWIPGRKRRMKVTGELSYTPEDGGVLKAYGDMLDYDGSVYIPVLHGETDIGRVTLLDSVFEHSHGQGDLDRAAQEYSCETVISGGYVNVGSLYTRLSLTPKHLAEWARIGAIMPTTSLSIEERHVGLGHYYERVEAQTSELTDGSGVSLGVAPHQTYSGNKATLDIRHVYSVTPGAPKNLGDLLTEYVRPLVDLLTIAMDRPSHVLELHVTPQARGWTRPYEVGLRLGRALHDDSVPVATQTIQYSEFSFEKQLRSWFDINAKLHGVVGLILGLFYSPEMTVENRFLNAATAVESLHRATFKSTRGNVKLSGPEFDAWLNSHAEAEQELIKTRANQYINDPSLSDRLSELVNKAGVSFHILTAQPTPWVDLVKKVRNDLTHQKGVPKRRVSPTQLYTLADSVAFLATLCILRDLGFSESELASMGRRSLRIRALAQDMRLVHPDLYNSADSVSRGLSSGSM